MNSTTHLLVLDRMFAALANIHRREILHLVSLQPYSISALSEKRNLSFPAIHKHIRILEHAQLISRKKIGTTTIITLKRQSLRLLQDWLMQYHAYWGHDEETFENYQKYLKKNSPLVHGTKSGLWRTQQRVTLNHVDTGTVSSERR